MCDLARQQANLNASDVEAVSGFVIWPKMRGRNIFPMCCFCNTGSSMASMSGDYGEGEEGRQSGVVDTTSESTTVSYINFSVPFGYSQVLIARAASRRSIAPSGFAATRCYSLPAEPNDVAVLGGGITGLATAHYLAQSNPNRKVTIYESSPRLGGWLHTEKVEIDDGHILFEKGPRTLRPAGNGALTARLVNQLGLEDDTIFTLKTAPAATNRYIYYPDHIVRVPAPDPQKGFVANASALIYALTSEPAFKGIVSRVLLEPSVSARDPSVTDESVGDFFVRRIGRRLVDQVMSAVVHGIYAGDIYQLSMKSLFPSIWRLEEEHGSVLAGLVHNMAEGAKIPAKEVDFINAMKQPYPFSSDFRKNFRRSNVFTFRHGLQQLVDKLEETLKQQSNVTFQLDQDITDIKNTEHNVELEARSSTRQSLSKHKHTHVISTLSPDTTSRVATSMNRDFLNLPVCPTPTVMTVNLYYRTPNLNPPGFGYLIPLDIPIDQNPERALGVTFDTAYSASTPGDKDFVGPMQDTVSNRGTKLTVMLGGHFWNGWSSYPTKEEGLQMAESVVGRHLGITEKPAAHSVNLNYNCIPQYTVGFEDRVKRFHDELSMRYSGRLRVAGNWVRGVGVNDCIRSAWEVARELDTSDLTGLEWLVKPKNWVSVKSLLFQSESHIHKDGQKTKPLTQRFRYIRGSNQGLLEFYRNTCDDFREDSYDTSTIHSSLLSLRQIQATIGSLTQITLGHSHPIVGTA
ncbi:Protoporphyrinogen oxidase, partial [Aureobasidium melanogenum]